MREDKQKEWEIRKKSAQEKICEVLGLDVECVTSDQHQPPIDQGELESNEFSFEIKSEKNIKLCAPKIAEIQDYFLCFIECDIDLYCSKTFSPFYGRHRKEIDQVNRGKLSFEKCHFSEKINLSEIQLDALVFDKCIFEKDLVVISTEIKTYRLNDNTFGQGCYCHNSIIWSSSYCHRNIFKGRVDFANTVFKDKLDLSYSVFENDVDFSNANFGDFINFCKSKFEKKVSFYGVNFFQAPNFSQAIFKDSLNLVNSNLKFDYQNLHILIINYLKAINKNRPKNEDQSLDSISRLVCKTRSSLANDFRDSFRLFKNTLAKEGNLLDASNYHRIELYCKEIELDSEFKEKRKLSDWIDWFQLWFYRHTSDHHTDLVKILSWVIVSIGGFGLLLFACRYGLDMQSFFENHSKDLYINFFNQRWITESKLMGLIYLIGFCSLFLSSIKAFFFGFITLSICVIQPRYIFGVANLLDGHSRSGLENLLFVFYSLLMLLFLFSLQKTARKNSIVPN